ncbi:hypothetical protein KY347_05130 [Candidatus Woesearchaeota archaeon]|nr:hypothetical protein [Candidatus Woesearchaeota archaeon]
MRIKVRYVNAGGFTRMENSVNIKEVMINEDFLHPENESIAVGFRNKDSSGIIEFTVEEFEKMANSVKRKTHLIKGFKTFGKSGAIKVE